MNVLSLAIQNNFKNKIYTKQKIPVKLQHKKQNINKKNTAASFIGSSLGIAASVAAIYFSAKKISPSVSLKNLTYDERDIIKIAAGSILGGLAGGLLTDKNKNNRIAKFREASQQFFGSILCPVGILAMANKALEKSKFEMPKVNLNSKAGKSINTAIKALPQISVTIGSLVLGMHLGNFIMNKVNNKIFNQNENHKVHASDYLVHTDDMCVAASLLLKNSKAVSSVTSKLLPASFILAGTKTGMKQA